MWIDNDFPKLLGAELYRPHPAYIIEMAVEPVVVHDFSKQPGQTVQLDRYRFWGKPGTKESRERTADQTLGTASARNIVKDKVLVTLREYTGPADTRDTAQPSTFKVARETLITAQRLLLDTGNLNVFHQSIGSLTLLDDYRRWRDRVFANELLKAEANGAADKEQGGYYLPGGKEKGGSGGTLGVTYAEGESAKFDVTTDLLEVVKDMRKRNVPTFADGYYRCIVDPTAMMHLRQNSDFREIARYPRLWDDQSYAAEYGTQRQLLPRYGSCLRSSRLCCWSTRYAYWLPLRGCPLVRVHQPARDFLQPGNHRRSCRCRRLRRIPADLLRSSGCRRGYRWKTTLRSC